MIHKETCSCGASLAIRSLLVARVRVAVKAWRRQHQHRAEAGDASTEPYRGEHGGGAVLEQAFEAPSVDVRRRTARIGFGLGTIARDGEGS